MNIFLLLGNVHDAIEKYMNDFLWGQGLNGGDNIDVMGEVMCDKEPWRLGVRSIRNFNIVMLPKQGYRILNRANPMVSEIMQ